jgi:hypothetical protein
MKLLITIAALLTLASPALAYRASGRVQPKPPTVEAAKQQATEWRVCGMTSHGKVCGRWMSHARAIASLNALGGGNLYLETRE